MSKHNVFDEAAELQEYWSQKVLCQANGNLFKVAKGIGAVNWHSHEDQDETFLLLEGNLTVQLRDREVDLRPGDLFTVPRGVEHAPIATEEARFLIVGPAVTSNAAGGKPAWSYRDGNGYEQDPSPVDSKAVDATE
ncbi:cupin domain-containing protein [Arthrobacter bambusae]|uniref:Mannose-6-phosphate isomerase-like protein (Cupin superfamily) n=1 Tax=Arthrobacter bambusae TaxID=1338426 RepID=A0AAW8D9Y5_9MICC|nr:cupin domain-containing protein [Arthrobacter bambusae]MDP9904550.1 mannose-6-phosphate isomerase-like protein (cupin superfamily) [Arthrobacter bambusae]MDQ0129365.1 mannose-6-phosphate isomerase-like protein (cupin superfamily) [Arthrobacter bambusae]MDQ0181022.1 mannose-6-phosphate isomerase-like protein (cupin superfamily) [Arthrobacter bambusae]